MMRVQAIEDNRNSTFAALAEEYYAAPGDRTQQYFQHNLYRECGF